MKKYRNIYAVLVLCLSIVTVISYFSNRIYYQEKEECFLVLRQFTEKMAYEIQHNLEMEQEFLKQFSRLFAKQDSMQRQEVQALLGSIETIGAISRLELLLPDGGLLGSDGIYQLPDGERIFSEIASQEVYTSDRMSDVAGDGMVVRICIPIRQGADVEAALCGVMDLSVLSELYRTDIYDSSAQIYLIDGENGDFLLDTWHGELGNTRALRNRQGEDDFSVDRMHSDIVEGNAGTVVFRSESMGENFYCYYMSIGMNEWRLMLSVPESQVFRRADAIIVNFYHMALLCVLVMGIYILFALINWRKGRREIEDELKRMRYMFDVEKQLFYAHREPEHIEEALKLVAAATSAGRAFLFLIEGRAATQRYVWSEPEPFEETEGNGSNYDDIDIYDELKRKGAILSYHTKELREAMPGIYTYCERRGIHSLAIIPVCAEKSDDICGILGVCNMREHLKNTDMLRCVSSSFFMVINNIHSYQSVREMGMVDSLTGLLNRNSYQIALEELQNVSFHSLACVYMDVNGLHEVNNHLGHDAGDSMLKDIAEEIRSAFGENSTYRIGGDEFVVLCKNMSETYVERQAQALYARIKNMNYEFSVGIEWRDSGFDIKSIINAAETKMQQAKHRYYQQKGDARKIREMNRHLEKMLLEKKDAETFLSTIAASFKGVYFVNLNQDSVRHIYIPDYFNEILHECGEKYSDAIRVYGMRYVEQEYVEDFLKFSGYEGLEQAFFRNEVPELVYRKKDGTLLKLHVYQSENYREDDKETLWVFENLEKAREGGGN